MECGQWLRPPPPTRGEGPSPLRGGLPDAARHAGAKIARIRSSLPKHARYALDSHTLWTAYFDCGHSDQHAATNGAEPRRRYNSEGWRQWWGVPRRTLEAILEHIEAGNSPLMEYPAGPSFSRRRGNSWTPRRMEMASSSSSGSRSSGSPELLPFKPETRDTPLGRCNRSGALVIKEGGVPSPPSFCLVKLKTEPEEREHIFFFVSVDSVTHFFFLLRIA